MLYFWGGGGGGGGGISAVNVSDDPLPYKTSVIDDPYLIFKRNFFCLRILAMNIYFVDPLPIPHTKRKD